MHKPISRPHRPAPSQPHAAAHRPSAVHPSPTRVVALLIALLITLASTPQRAVAAPASADAWNPQRTWVFVVGILEWKDAQSYAPFPKTNRRDVQLEQLLVRRGVPQDHIVALHDRAATRPAVLKAYRDLLARTAPGDELIVYFCGHGDKTEDGEGWFVTYDAGSSTPATTWSMRSVVTDLQAGFKGRRALLLADCCYSGTMAENTRESRGQTPVAALTSSSSSTESTGNWTFTESVIAGLQGDASVDLDHDGAITLDEIARYTLGEMRFADGQRSTFRTTKAYGASPRMAGVSAQAKPRQGEHVEVSTEGAWWKARVLDSRAKEVRVHYYGYETSDDAWVPLSKVRIEKTKTYPTGAAVQVLWKKVWYPATVLQVQDGLHLIHYEGYPATWDEWVDVRRMKAR